MSCTRTTVVCHVLLVPGKQFQNERYHRSLVLSSMRLFIIHALLGIVIAGSSLARCQGRVFDITTFGAVGDGKADDTSAIRRAFAAAAAATLPTSTRCVVLFPFGQTFLSGPLNITRSNIVLRIDGTLRAIDANNLRGGGEYIRHEWPQILPLPSYQHSDDLHYLQQYQFYLRD